MIRKLSTLASAIILITGLGLVSTARADTLHEAVWFKTNQPLELPDRVIGPGQYQLSFVGTNRNVVMLSTKDGQHLGFFQVMPAQLDHVAQSAKMILSRPIPNNPDRIREWTYPGEDIAYVPEYPSVRTNMLAQHPSAASVGGQ